MGLTKVSQAAACEKGHSEIAEMKMKNSSDLKIDLNIKDIYGHTGFHRACNNGHSEIAEIIMKKSSELKLDLNIKDKCGSTAFQRACGNGHLEIGRNDTEEFIRTENRLEHQRQ